jgi:hypothetical protein
VRVIPIQVKRNKREKANVGLAPKKHIL